MCRAVSSSTVASTTSEASDAQAIARSASAVQAVKDAVAELRVSVKSAVAHREKCSILLSAAMAASLALDQVLISYILQDAVVQYLMMQELVVLLHRVDAAAMAETC